MKLNKETLKKIIKEELAKSLLLENNLMTSDERGNPAYESLLISPNYIKQDMDSKRHFGFGEPDYHANMVMQGLRGEVLHRNALDSAFELYMLVTADEEDRHPAFPKDEKSRSEIMNFLDFAIDKLQ